MACCCIPESVDECFEILEEILHSALIYTNLRLTLCYDKVMGQYYVSLYHTKKDGEIRSIALSLEEGRTLQCLLPKLVSLNSRCHGIWSKDVDKEKVLFASDNVRYTLLSFMGMLYVDIRKI